METRVVHMILYATGRRCRGDPMGRPWGAVYAGRRGLRPLALGEPLSAAQGEGHGGDLQQDHQRGQDPSAQAEATELVDKAIQLVA